MQQTIRHSSARVNMVVGPMVMLIGLAAAITAVVLSLTLSTAWFLALLLPAVLALAAGGFIIWISRRSRLEIRTDGVTWCGPLGAESFLAWTQVQQILPAPPGSPRTAAITELTDGSRVPIEAPGCRSRRDGSQRPHRRTCGAAPITPRL